MLSGLEEDPGVEAVKLQAEGRVATHVGVIEKNRTYCADLDTSL